MSEPREGDFVVMTQLRRTRLEINVDSSADCRFTASIAGTRMTVTHVSIGTVALDSTVFGVGVAAGTTVKSQTSGSAGGIGAYVVSVSQIVPSTTLSCGSLDVMQPVEVSYQLDIHGPASADNAQVISTLMRDEFGVQQFANQSPNYGVVPLYADDPRQAPFLNEAQAYEWRWVVEAMLQANPIISVPLQYADAVSVEVVSVDETYPP